MSARVWTMQEIEQLKATSGRVERRVLLSELGYHERAAFGHVTVNLWPYGRDGHPAQGHLSHPELSGADLEALVSGDDTSELDAAFWEALATGTDDATAWTIARGFERASDEPLERTPESIARGRVLCLLLPVED